MPDTCAAPCAHGWHDTSAAPRIKYTVTMQTTSIPPLLLLLASLSACASYVPPANKPTATLAFYIHNDSANTRMRNGAAYSYVDAECERTPVGNRLSSNISMEEHDEMPTKPIEANQDFTFAMATTEVLWGGNAGCSVTATFAPKANESYEARLFTRGNAASCKMVIVDKENREVPFTRPKYSCVQSLKGITANGIGWYKAIDVHIYLPVK